MTAHRPAAPLVAVIALFALLVTGCVSEPGDTFTATLQAGGALVLCYCALMIGRAIAARIAGDHAEEVLGMSLISITLPALPRRRSDTVDEKQAETGNTTTPENTKEQPETPDFMAVSNIGAKSIVPSMTREEHEELIRVRHEAIGLLNKCVTYYQDNSLTDDGTIPRYDKIKMNADDRGKIVDNLWYSTYIVKTKNKTYTDPAYHASCQSLMRAIISGKAKVYPLGYSERKQELMDSAVMALPANERHD